MEIEGAEIYAVFSFFSNLHLIVLPKEHKLAYKIVIFGMFMEAENALGSRPKSGIL